MRIVVAIFVGWAGMIVYIAERVIRPASNGVEGVLFKALSVMAVLAGAGALLVRLKAVPAARRQLSRSDLPARMLWSLSHFGGLALSEAVLLFGFLLRFLGAGTKQVIPFYLVGATLMVSFFPRALESPDSSPS